MIHDPNPAQNAEIPLSETPAGINLQQLADAIRSAGHLDAKTQNSLAELLEELGKELSDGRNLAHYAVPLAHAVGAVAKSLHEQQETGLLESARERLKEVVAQAEIEAPVATGVVNRFLDVLANIGI